MEAEYCLLPFLRDLMLVVRGGIVKQVMMLKDSFRFQNISDFLNSVFVCVYFFFKFSCGCTTFKVEV